MLPEDQQIEYKYNFVRRSVGDKRLIHTAFENSLKTPVEIWERPAFEESGDRNAGGISLIDFEDEAQMLTTIRHESVLQVYDYCSKNGYHYLASEVTGGVNLHEVFRERPELFTISNTLKWSEQLVAAIDFLHRQSPALIHGEIKPENIILTPDGKIKLLPFGIAASRFLTEKSRSQYFDAAGLHYSPLEQIWSGLDSASQKTLLRNYDDKSEQILRRPVDAQSDVYSLAATVYYLLTQRPPIDALERSIDLLDGKKDPLIAPSALNSGIAVEISDSLMKALAIKREQRLVSTGLMLRSFKNFPAKTPRSVSEQARDSFADKIKAPAASNFPSPIFSQPATQSAENHLEIQRDKIQQQFSNVVVTEVIATKEQIKQMELTAPPVILKETLPEKSSAGENSVQSEDSFLSFEETKITDESSTAADSMIAAKVELALPVSNADSSVFESVLVAPPPNGGRRAAIIAIVVMLIIGVSAGVIWKVGMPKSAVMPQTVSAEEKSPDTPKQNASAVAQSPITDSQTNSLAETNANPVTGTVENELPKTGIVRETDNGAQISKNKPVAISRSAKPTAAPNKEISEKKKIVTVDDLINDN